MSDREFGMSAWGSSLNPYSDARACGLDIIAEIEYSDQNYCFDTRVVWRDLATGTLWTARNEGCSCPAPFEDYHKLSDLERLTTVDTLRAEHLGELAGRFYRGDGPATVSGELAKVQAALDALSERRPEHA